MPASARVSIKSAKHRAAPSSAQPRESKRKLAHRAKARQKRAPGIPLEVMKYAVRLIDPPPIADETSEKPF